MSLEKLHAHLHNGQRVFHLVGNTSRQSANQLHFLCLHKLELYVAELNVRTLKVIQRAEGGLTTLLKFDICPAQTLASERLLGDIARDAEDSKDGRVVIAPWDFVGEHPSRFARAIDDAFLVI